MERSEKWFVKSDALAIELLIYMQAVLGALWGKAVVQGEERAAELGSWALRFYHHFHSYAHNQPCVTNVIWS